MFISVSPWFIPLKKNKYKAYLLRSRVVGPLVVVLFFAHIIWFYQLQVSQQILGSQTDLTASEIVSLTNLERTKVGVGTLQPNPILNQAAEKKAQNMVEAGVFDHYYEDQGELINPWQFILDAGYEYFHAGENLGKDFSSSTALVKAWIKSPTHRDNLLNPDYKEIGVAVVSGPYLDKEDTTLVVQLFATPISAIDSQSQKYSQPGDINVAPLLENEGSWAQEILNQYPALLFGSTFIVTVMIGVTLLIDVESQKKKANVKEVSIDLWRH